MFTALVDANYIVALGYKRDKQHQTATEFSRRPDANLLLPEAVLVEAIYNLERLGGINATIEFMELLVSATPQFISLTQADFMRAMEIMRRYRDAELDFVDCCLTALAERLNITKICTFDRRDFSIIRPKHTEFFELLP
jgi:predicted nucleic acid-binding protein